LIKTKISLTCKVQTSIERVSAGCYDLRKRETHFQCNNPVGTFVQEFIPSFAENNRRKGPTMITWQNYKRSILHLWERRVISWLI